MKKSLEITLYHSEQCGHCVTFKPEWKRLQKNLAEAKNKYNGIPIKLEDIEESQSKGVMGTINGKEIDGYPTIKFKLTIGDKSKEYDYADYGKKRDCANMSKLIINICNGMAEYSEK
jgi:hypothetical protein